MLFLRFTLSVNLFSVLLHKTAGQTLTGICICMCVCMIWRSRCVMMSGAAGNWLHLCATRSSPEFCWEADMNRSVCTHRPGLGGWVWGLFEFFNTLYPSWNDVCFKTVMVMHAGSFCLYHFCPSLLSPPLLIRALTTPRLNWWRSSVIVGCICAAWYYVAEEVIRTPEVNHRHDIWYLLYLGHSNCRYIKKDHIS